MKRHLVKFIPIVIKPALEKIYYFLIDLIDRLRGRDSLIPPKSMIKIVGGGDFEKTGQEFKRYFIELANVQPNDRVLDVGCGCGRMAVPLTNYLSQEGEYWGFDIVKRGIDWCQSRISSKFENFHFQHSDVHNRAYNPNGNIRAKDFQFPFKDDYFDFIFLTSVFTHMLPSDLENYLSEISRVLKQSGRCLITFFLLNEESENLIRAGCSTLDFKYKIGGCLTIDDNNPESAIAYNEDFVKGLFGKYKLKIIQPIHYGSWCKRDTFLSYQDILVATKEHSNLILDDKGDGSILFPFSPFREKIEPSQYCSNTVPGKSPFKEGMSMGMITLPLFVYGEKSGCYFPPQATDSSFGYSDGVAVEGYLLSVVKRARDLCDGSEELMRAVKNWPSYYHLGSGRSNILKALDLSSNARVLEMGSGCGGVTRYLGERFSAVDGIEASPKRAQIAHERCRNLGNVKIYCANLNRLELEPIYDVVTIIGVLEYAPLFFKKSLGGLEACKGLIALARSALKPDGMLIIAIENRLGLKYWAGCSEDHTGRVYDSIHGYPYVSPLTFARKELTDILKDSGFKENAFYFCFPDYKFASTILSDVDTDKLYLHNWVGIPFGTPGHQREHTFHEGLAARSLSHAGLLKEFANSFLVVAGNNTIPASLERSGWAAKRFSTDRKREYQTITTLRLDPGPYVTKERVSDSCSADSPLIQEISDTNWIKGDLMIFDVYQAMVRDDWAEALYRVIERYYTELMKRYSIGKDDEEGFPLVSGEALDFIFRNIISNDGHLSPIDLEWKSDEPIGADYVLYRCIVSDITVPHYAFFSKKIRRIRPFVMHLMKRVFPQYGRKRHEKNISREEAFQDFVKTRTGS